MLFKERENEKEKEKKRKRIVLHISTIILGLLVIVGLVTALLLILLKNADVEQGKYFSNVKISC